MSQTESAVTIVTGAASGIGAATARCFAERGDVVVCADRDLPGAEQVSAECGGQALQLDVSDADACDRVVADVLERFGRIDSLVHAAGIWEPARAEATTTDSFDRVIDVNLKGTFLVARAVARAMIDTGTGGSMVLVGSVNSVRAGVGQLAYAASKGGVLMLGQVMALEWAEHDIRVNVVAPGLTNTAMTAGVADEGGRGLDALMARTPMRRSAEPSEIAATIEFLCSARASYTTGAYSVVDGGWLID